MKTRKIDPEKCYNALRYSEKFGIPPATVYYRMNRGYYKMVELHGKKFIYVED